MNPHRYPLDRLARVVGCTVPTLLARHGIIGSGAAHMRDDGVLAHVADRIAIAEGLHPLLVWPEFDDETRARVAQRRARQNRDYQRRGDARRAQRRDRYRKRVAPFDSRGNPTQLDEVGR